MAAYCVPRDPLAWFVVKARRVLLSACAVALVACGGGSPSEVQEPTGTSALPGRLATNGTSEAVITTVLPPEVRPGNRFGTQAVLRDNGNTLIVAAPGDPLNPNTGQFDPIASAGPPFRNWGSVHILARLPGPPFWQQTALLRPAAGPDDNFASVLAVSGDGNTIAVGARFDRSRGSGIGSDPRDHEPVNGDSRFTTGAVWVYVKRDGIWQLQEFIKAAQPGESDLFGASLALSHDGNSMAVGAPLEGNRDDGAVHLFRRDAAGRWALADHIKASNAAAAGSIFGTAVQLSADGRMLAVGASGDSSADCRINGNQQDNSQPGNGAVYVFERTPQDRMQQSAYIKACDRPGVNGFGQNMAMTPAGDLLVVGAPGDDAELLSCDNVPGSQLVGRVYVIARSGAGWVRSGALGASNPAPFDVFGSDVKMSADGSTLAIGAAGAAGENGGGTGVDPPQDDHSGFVAGAIYVFRRGADGTYTQAHYVKPPRVAVEGFIAIGDRFLNGLDLSDDGSVLVIGSNFAGPPPPNAPDVQQGAVFVYDGLF